MPDQRWWQLRNHTSPCTAVYLLAGHEPCKPGHVWRPNPDLSLEEAVQSLDFKNIYDVDMFGWSAMQNHAPCWLCNFLLLGAFCLPLDSGLTYERIERLH
eukprot:5976075-Amphidinium_carterae.1